MLQARTAPGEASHIIILIDGEVIAYMQKNENAQYITRRIGSTTYKVKVVFDDAADETLEDKILRLIQNESLASGEKCDTMLLPQMSRQSERSA